MHSFTISKIITMSIVVYLCAVAPGASGRTNGAAALSRYPADASRIKLAKSAGMFKPGHDNNNTSFTGAQRGVGTRRDRNKNRGNMKKTKDRARKTLVRSRAATPTRRRRQNEQPTPEPTGEASTSTTVYASSPDSFALLLPRSPGEMVSDAEQDAVAYCTDGSGCGNAFPDGFITGAAYSAAADGSYVQITGCMDPTKFPFADNDDGGQFDVRYPNGAQCTFGGYGASFIEQVEPLANRFCLRCCKSADDQQNCNSHQDRAGCPMAVPGTYAFGQVNCS